MGQMIVKDQVNVSDRIYRCLLIVAYRLCLLFWWAFRPRGRGVNVALEHAGKILIIKNSYKSTFTLPGGLPQKGESLPETAAREIMEEVNVPIAIHKLHLKGTFYSTQEYKRDQISIFEYRCANLPKWRIDRREVIWAAWMTPEGALQLNLCAHVRAYISQHY
jgi:ADP-ribose pyrophosphatase YjhB (NUDIX family)